MKGEREGEGERWKSIAEMQRENCEKNNENLIVYLYL